MSRHHVEPTRRLLWRAALALSLCITLLPSARADGTHLRIGCGNCLLGTHLFFCVNTRLLDHAGCLIMRQTRKLDKKRATFFVFTLDPDAPSHRLGETAAEV